MNNIQKIIEDLQNEVSAMKQFEIDYISTNTGYWAKGRRELAETLIPKLTLLLNAETQTTVKSKPA